MASNAGAGVLTTTLGGTDAIVDGALVLLGGTSVWRGHSRCTTSLSSLNCSNCAKVVKKTLSTGTHTCPYCGHIQDRDHNAARNILEKALRTAAGHVGTKDTALGGDADL